MRIQPKKTPALYREAIAANRGKVKRGIDGLAAPLGPDADGLKGLLAGLGTALGFLVPPKRRARPVAARLRPLSPGSLLQTVSMCIARPRRNLRAGDILSSARAAAAAGLLVLAISACGRGEDFPAPPRTAPIVLPVMVSANGRVITVRAAKPCGHRPLLLARSSPDRVTLRLVNRDVRDCHVEAVGVISVSVTLPRALGSRQLVQAVNGKPIKYRMTTVTPASKEPGQHGVNAKALACERRQKICNRAAWRALPLRSPDGAGAALMTEAQAIAAVGWRNGDKVGAHLMTYGQAMATIHRQSRILALRQPA